MMFFLKSATVSGTLTMFHWGETTRAEIVAIVARYCAFTTALAEVNTTAFWEYPGVESIGTRLAPVASQPTNVHWKSPIVWVKGARTE